MNEYELTLVLNRKLEEGEKAATLEKTQSHITRFNSTMTNVNDWDKKRFAYDVQKVKEGFHYFIKFESEDISTPSELEASPCILEPVARYLIARDGAVEQPTQEAAEQFRKSGCTNKVVLIGGPTRDPEVRYSSGGKFMAIARYTPMAGRRSRRGGSNGEQAADFVPCVAFDRTAEFAEKYFRQGTHVLVSGRTQTSNYTNREGQKVYITEVILGDREFAGNKGVDNGGNGNYSNAPQIGYAEGRRPGPQDANTEGLVNILDGVEDEGLPFN